MLKDKMKRFVAVVLACMTILSCLPALALSFPCTGFVKENAALRKGTGDNAQTIMTLPTGDAVYVVGDSGNYYIVEYDGSTGFVHKSYIALEGEVTQPNAPTSEQAARYPALYQGSENQLVRDMQKALIELGFLKGTADGKYGKKTAEAVESFQEKNQLNATGSADAATLGLLFEGKVKNNKGNTKEVTVAPSVEGFPISSGKTGDSVAKLQIALKDLSYYSGKIDGKCGTGTVKAIKAFQKKHDMKQTGIADAEMQKLLYGGAALSAKATATPKPTATPVPPVIGWEDGDTGSEATFPYDTFTNDSVNLRKKASTSSARLLSMPKGAQVRVLAVKGDFLQVEYEKGGKTYSGYAMTKYIELPAIYLGGEALKENLAAQKKYTSLTSGASSQSVTTLQEALSELGFYTQSKNSGVYDAATITAVKAFQRENGILQTGNATAELQQLIYEGKPLNVKGKKKNVSVLPPIAGVDMRQGDSGYQVKELQQALKDLGFYTGAVNGAFDNATYKAVKKYQQANKLYVDGVVGEKTRLALGKSLSTPTPPLNYVTPAPTPITADNVIVIHRGTRGLVVTRLQERLVELGYYSITPDGIYDTNDINAVRAFQKKNGLKVDGVAGLEVQQLLYSDAAAPEWATPTPKPTQTPKPAPTEKPETDITLSIGSRGTEVNLLQARLTVLKYLNDTIDGRYGTKTAEAVAAFQENNGLKADGIAGPKTLKKIYSATAKEAPETVKPTQTPSPKDTLIRIGDRGDDVKKVQQMLITAGYLTGAADGIFGPKTALAVKAFQRANKLGADGIVGEKTLLRLQAVSEEDTDLSAKPNTNVDAGVTGTDFKAPKAIEVRYANWYTEIRDLARQMPNAIIYDFETGLHYNVNMFSFGKHCDAEPITASDTATMRKIMGTENWTPHAVWVILSNGRVYMASTHSKGHSPEHNLTNDLDGHICIHFPREKSEAEETGPYAVSHQNEIRDGWGRTQMMIFQ